MAKAGDRVTVKATENCPSQRVTVRTDWGDMIETNHGTLVRKEDTTLKEKESK
jgi:hypothetical protein